MSENHTFPEDKLVLRYWNCAGRGMLMRYMAYDSGLDFVEEILAGSSSGFAVGSEITMADFAIFYIVDILAQRMLMVKSGPAAVKLLFGDKPALAKHKEMMQARPNMSQYRSSAQWNLYGHHISGKGVMGDRTHELGLGDTELEGIEILTSKLVTCLS